MSISAASETTGDERISPEQDDIDSVADLLCMQTGEDVTRTVGGIMACFERHCSIEWYGAHVWDDKFLPAFELAQDLLIDEGLISEESCMRTMSDQDE